MERYVYLITVVSVQPRLFLWRVHVVLFVCVVLLCVFTFRVPCRDVRYDFHIKTMFDSSLPPVDYWRAHVLFTFICACLRIVVSNEYRVVFLVCSSSSRGTRFSGLYFLIAPSNVYLHSQHALFKSNSACYCSTMRISSPYHRM